ncbi:MAG: carboxypeptidase regulatory-like domain-containing protein [Planctomycetes bacterium]|nr:carboxypeptidase regulatory-like domain-containing protein [Planctomycetota bacterium]
MRRFLRTGVSALFLLAMTSAPALAHALGVDCQLRGGKVEVEAFFDDDSPAEKARVEVRSLDDQVIARGSTDAKGRWSFAVPAPGNYLVHVDAGAGHRAKKSIVIPPFGTPPAPTPVTIDGTNSARQDFTGTPWVRIAIGLAAIGAGSAALVLAMRLRKRD